MYSKQLKIQNLNTSNYTNETKQKNRSPAILIHQLNLLTFLFNKCECEMCVRE